MGFVGTLTESHPPSMTDFDEFSEGSFELDDAALASIQATEERFGVSLSQARAPSSQPPPSKRRKITDGRAEPETNRSESRPTQPSLRRVDSVDDPEIFVNPDGSYAIRAAATQSFHEAQDEKFSIAGEVSNLRRTIDKMAREHAEAIAKIKCEKEAAEKAKAELQIRLKEETDRITTRLIFKQQELETSTKKGTLGFPSSRRMTKEFSPGSPQSRIENRHQLSLSSPIRELDDESAKEPVFRVEELRRIVFTHVTPGTGMLTLQALLSAPLPERMSAEKRQAYVVASHTIIGACGTKYGHIRYPEQSQWETLVVGNIASAFIIIGELLSDAGCIEPLVALLDLMAMLTLHFPAFLTSFLGPAVANDILHPPHPDSPSRLLSMLENIVRDHIALTQTAHAGGTGNTPNAEKLRLELAVVVVQLMESLYWNLKDGLEEHSKMMSCRCQVLEMLLHVGQPPELIKRTLRLIVLITTHKHAFRSLISYTAAPAVESSSLHNRPPFTLIERLCSFLVDPPLQSNHSIRKLIITFISILCSMPEDMFSILLDSTLIIPSMVICITDLSRLLWEDNMDVVNSAAETKLAVESLHLSMNLLRNLIIASETHINLAHRLMEVTHLPGPFNGITHMFMVTFGRLSWAEIPSWLHSDYRGICEIISELAIEVIETVVVGPEFDSLWAVWHTDEELNDEEFEAQKIQIE